ncbi:uncharacterized protein LOC124172400 [Ischnura elegans]|uniref:uncharacterized protein LOC124172400 n=1 Tax=Ischnura elegans TaxID=197161 RepID=UPI001ED8B043|nr:uncharacterized protein LOC124172400 [Ischnura elegans]
MLYTYDPAGISTYVSDPLATDELSNPVTYKCPSVKEYHISDDEDGYRLNDCTDGASSKLIHQDISGQSDPVTYDCSSVKNDQISDDEEENVVNDCSDGFTSNQVHQDSSNQPITLTASHGEKVDTQGTGAMVEDLEWTLIGVKKEPSLEENAQLTLGKDGEPVESFTIAQESTTKAFGHHPQRAGVLSNNHLYGCLQMSLITPWSPQHPFHSRLEPCHRHHQWATKFRPIPDETTY